MYTAARNRHFDVFIRWKHGQFNSFWLMQGTFVPTSGFPHALSSVESCDASIYLCCVFHPYFCHAIWVYDIKSKHDVRQRSLVNYDISFYPYPMSFLLTGVSGGCPSGRRIYIYILCILSTGLDSVPKLLELLISTSISQTHWDDKNRLRWYTMKPAETLTSYIGWGKGKVLPSSLPPSTCHQRNIFKADKLVSAIDLPYLAWTRLPADASISHWPGS